MTRAQCLDEFVVGYGLDCSLALRSLPYVRPAPLPCPKLRAHLPSLLTLAFVSVPS